jgi:hypothetical protein
VIEEGEITWRILFIRWSAKAIEHRGRNARNECTEQWDGRCGRGCSRAYHRRIFAALQLLFLTPSRPRNVKAIASSGGRDRVHGARGVGGWCSRR